MTYDEQEARLLLLEAHVENLIERVHELETKPRSGRKRKPIQVSIEGICGVDPERDSSTCPDASVYRRQSGCQGMACKTITNAYHAARRQSA